MITIICNSNMVKKLVIGVMCESWFTILITSKSAKRGMNHTESSHFDDTLKRGDRRRDDADPGDRTSGIITLAWWAFFERLLPSPHLTWWSFSTTEDSLLSVENDKDGADVEIVEDSWWWVVNWGKIPVESYVPQ